MKQAFFTGALGEKPIAICLVPGVPKISDLDGVTYLKYDPEDTERMREQLHLWLDKKVRDDRPPKSENNLLMKPRQDIHQIYPIGDRLHTNDDGYKHIRRIRIMNLASNLLVNPEIANVEHIHQSPTALSKAMQKILQETSATLDLMLIEPHSANLRDSVTKMANSNAGPRENLVYSAWETIYNNLLLDTIYKKAYDQHRFCCFSINIGIPYALFSVEFDREHEKYDHVKIDLYSSEIGNENQRRSFIVWKDLDPENFTFLTENFDSVKRNLGICQQPDLPTIKGWIDEWNNRRNA